MSFRTLAFRLEEEPWSWPLRLGAGVQMLRSRWIIEAIDAEGTRHQAELAPCPGVHPESLDAARHAFEGLFFQEVLGRRLPLHQWNWTRPAFGLLALPPTLTSVQTALEQLLLSWAQVQNPGEVMLPAPVELPGSALISLMDWEVFVELWDAGYRCFKAKIGRQKAAVEAAFLQRMQDYADEGLQLRLDANQALNADDRDFWLEHGQTLPVQYWEESPPFTPRALDESLWDKNGKEEAADAWIIKPTRLTLSRSIQLLKDANAAGRLCVLSNAFDSGLTLRAAAWIYAAFCQNPVALGFGTVRYLPDDDWQSHAWGAPRVTVPQHPFGVQL